MITVWFNFPTEPDQKSMQLPVEVVPRIGESVGVVHRSGAHYRLDKVVDVRHYVFDGQQEIHVLLEP